MSNDRAVIERSYGSRDEIPLEDCKEHDLFLLELLVRRVSGDRLAKLNQMFSVPTSVCFQFLDFRAEDALMVTPVDLLFQPQAGVANDVEVFDAGKSVLFAVDRDRVVNRDAKFKLYITVEKRMPDGIKPDILVGAGELDLSDQYAALKIEMLQCWRKGTPTFKTFDGQVPLMHNGDAAGNLDVFVRISGFGQTIVTKFDAPQDPKSFVFSAGEADRSSMYKCLRVNSRAADLFENSSEDLGRPVTYCPVCVPERYPCLPCGKLAAVEKRDEIIGDDKGDDKETRLAQRKLKHMTSRGLIQSSRGPSGLCGEPVVLKVSGLFDNGDGTGRKKPTVTVADETVATKPGDQPDPDHDIFVLRIGKKGIVGVGEKSDIQLEMKTPKGPERRPPIRYETREMQTDVEEEPPKDKKKKKKKKRK